MLAIKLLLRNWRSGELRLMTASILLAVFVVCGISVFSQRLERSIFSQSRDMLGADGIVTSSQPSATAWDEQAQTSHISTSKTSEFEAMLIAGEEMTLASVKALDQYYPLRGRLEVVSQATQKTGATNKKIPATGTAWIDARLLSTLKIKLGEKIRLGELQLTVTEILRSEPDLFSFKPRILIHTDDLPKTALIQPGSRITYKWLIASDDTQELDSFIKSLKLQLKPEQNLVTPESVANGRGDAMKSIRYFLTLTTIFAVLLCGLAIAISSKQFAQSQVKQIALLKSFGLSALHIRKMLIFQLFAIAAVATLIGLACGASLHNAAAGFLLDTYQFELAGSRLSDYTVSLVCGVLCLSCFAIPSVWHLPAMPPMQVLQGEMSLPTSSILKRLLPAFAAIFLPILLMSKDALVSLIAITSLGTLLLFIMGIAKSWLYCVHVPMEKMGGSWRLALSKLEGQKWQSILQIAIFSIVILSMSSLVELRQNLLDQWQAQFPPLAPNHFLANITTSELTDVSKMLSAHGIRSGRFDPLILGRITHINGHALTNAEKAKSKMLEREVEISWIKDLPSGNTIVEGHWWQQAGNKKSVPGVSIDMAFAKKAGLHINDKLEFFIGGWSHQAMVTSIRNIAENARSSSFVFLLEPGSFSSVEPTYVSEFYLAATEKHLLHTLSVAHPGILIVEADRMFAMMDEMVSHASQAMLALLALSLIAGFLVMLASVLASMQERRQESAVLRAFGCSATKLQSSIWLEFFTMGLIAGSIAIAGTQALMFGLHEIILKTAMHFDMRLVILTPVLSATLLGSIGVLACRKAIKTPPASVLR